MSLEDWNRRYRAGEQLDQKHAPLVERFAGRLPPGKALDLACGPGRHALFLAERGWQVTAVDGSPIAIGHLGARASARNLPIDARLADLERGEFEIPADEYDLVIDFLYLQRDLIPAIQRGTRPGGMIIAVALISQQPTPTRVTPGELCALFAGCKILHSLEREVAELVAIRL